ncbi:Uncharacterized membrane protein YcfT [Quadrisphaera granulorum]|uniref:Putative membrane protein YcfT n=1 Tax=Quadrisphaera granulorum TaxID=317664 RepID=A0A316ABZ2_9ACTN|nr:acyltransferase family protein [Quadrisphaera granulorum]PWJ55131.1 putative membrane protein YcfT [Quadrisphaera granulorum]SZE95640.1 Uncharacterized membrane protein YcfT [Quadrisphaera granulorum]
MVVQKTRLTWADVARGAAMVLVVFAHALQLMDAYGWRTGALDTVNLYLTVLRMPLFFLVSGIFAATAIQRTWRGLFASRLALLIYLYLLWSVVRALWFSVVPWPLNETPPWVALLIAPVWPTAGLWFLYALVLYLLLAKATATWPTWAPLALTGALSVAAAYDVVPTGGNGVWRSVAMYAFFFLLGARLSQVWTSLAARATLMKAVGAALVVPLSVVAFTLLPVPLRGIGRTSLSLLCVIACLIVAAVVARWTPLARPLRYVGERTIAVYVVHPLLLAALVPALPVGSTPAVVAVVVLTAVAVVVPLLLRRVLVRASGFFDLPAPLVRRLAPYAERAPRPRSPLPAD